MASASKHELTLLFGSKEPPDKLAWGRPYVDGPGFETFSTCIGKDEDDLERVDECLKVAHQACIAACVEAETTRINHKGERHHGRDEARKKARNKPPVERDPQAP